LEEQARGMEPLGESVQGTWKDAHMYNAVLLTRDQDIKKKQILLLPALPSSIVKPVLKLTSVHRGRLNSQCSHAQV